MTARLSLCVVLLLLSACAETDPYRRIERVPTAELAQSELQTTFDSRWPERFKSTQTVTIDFGPVTRTLVGYLAIERPERFRLQGMTEQGLKLFDIARNEDGTVVVFAAEEMDRRVLDAVTRDIERVFLFRLPGVIEPDRNGESWTLEGNTPDQNALATLAGSPPVLDALEVRGEAGRLFRLDQYEWREFSTEAKRQYPSVVVLRDSGRSDGGPPYRLTLKLDTLEERETPWPEKVFFPEAGP